MDKLAKSEELDQASFWRFVNRSRKRCKKTNPIESSDGIITKPQAICDAWQFYFEQL